MITWTGQTRPTIDPYRRELHNVQMYFSVEHAAVKIESLLFQACALLIVFVAGLYFGGFLK